MNLLTFLYQTDFQLSSSSGNGLVEQKFACELLSLQICASVASSCETCWKWQQKFIFHGFYNPGLRQSRNICWAARVDLRSLVSLPAQMDDPNKTKTLNTGMFIHKLACVRQLKW
ncbi:hypothetical protein CRENBAI_011493 [Crenichthys baileyi]|uniref:Uncharacterized protein n=1 Tax=Crenichthys baileyi TaxID=28760 RepID=A0AAV9R0X4_9TELE